MKITPIEIERHQFQKVLRGCDPEEVKAFLNQEDFKVDQRNKPRVFANSIKIEKNIVSYSIKKEDSVITAASPDKETMHEEIQRPNELRGYTYKIKTHLTDDAMYITRNDN